MIGVDIAARGLAASAAAPGLAARFADLATLPLPSDLACVQTAGFSVPGMGGGTYVADPLADDAMLASHPRFCIRTVSGAILRLAPSNGAICVEQGGALGDGERDDAVDDRDAIQATLDYAAAAGIRTVLFGQRRYSIWTPQRSSALDSQDWRDGKALVASATVTLKSTCGDTVLSFRAHDGSSLEDNWQLVKATQSDPAPNRVWRGGGLFIQGDRSRTEPLSIEKLVIEHVHLHGGRARTGVHSVPADPVTGDGWDVTDKGLWLQDVHVGSLELRGVEITGFKGELFYIGGTGPDRISLTDCRFHTTNADAMNPGGIGEMDARDCRFGNAYQAIEGLGGKRSSYARCTFYDSDSSALWGGPVPAPIHNYGFATRDPALPVPFVELDDCTFDNVRTFHLGCWTRGRVTAIDTQVIVPTYAQNMCTDIDLEITGWADRRANLSLVTLSGPNNLDEIPDTDGFMRRPASNIAIRVPSAKPTQAAADAGRHFLNIFRLSGLFDMSGVTLSVGNARAAAHVVPYGSMPQQPLCLVPDRWIATNGKLGGGKVHDAFPDVTTQTAHIDIDPWGAGHCVHIHRTGTVTLGIAATVQFADRQRLRIYRGSGAAGRKLRLEPGAPGLALATAIELEAHGDYVELEHRAADGQWRLINTVASPPPS